MVRKLLFLMMLVMALLAVTSTIGCSKKQGSDGVRLKQVNDALISAGFKLDSFHPADASRFGAQSCAAGTLDGVDTMVCEYPSAQQSELGKRAGEDWIGQALTGTVLANGNTVLALADRAHADPNGKTIHKIAQAYRKTR